MFNGTSRFESVVPDRTPGYTSREAAPVLADTGASKGLASETSWGDVRLLGGHRSDPRRASQRPVGAAIVQRRPSRVSRPAPGHHASRPNSDKPGAARRPAFQQPTRRSHEEVIM